MINIIVVLLWIVITLAVSSFAAVLGKRYSVVYPIAIMASLMVIANVIASKMVMFGRFTVPAGVIVFSMTFLITDILSEKWGKHHAKTAVWAGFYTSLLLVLSIFITISWPAAPFAKEFGVMFAKVLGMTPRIVVASLFTYLISQHHDVWAFHFWKKVTKGKHLWLRNNASTIVSQLIDSVIFSFLAFYGVFPVVPVIIGAWVVKVIIAIVDTPFMYGIIWLMDRVKPARRKLSLDD